MVWDKETEGADRPTKVRKYESAYIKYGFTATQKNGHDYQLVI